METPIWFRHAMFITVKSFDSSGSSNLKNLYLSGSLEIASKIIDLLIAYYWIAEEPEEVNEETQPFESIIRDGRNLEMEHLISLILYTDFTELSADFTSTFRKKHPFEQLNDIKKRNREYWWLSKLLRETVEFFGDCRDDWSNGDIKGPFYTGMSVVLNMPHFMIRLCSPTSTSKQIEVAIKFGGEQGMVIELNSVDHQGIDEFNANYVRTFNCSWISRFKEEDERYI